MTKNKMINSLVEYSNKKRKSFTLQNQIGTFLETLKNSKRISKNMISNYEYLMNELRYCPNK